MIHDVILDAGENIEIVYEHCSPPLHSILKHQSYSESSDDLSSSVNSSHSVYSREGSRISVTSGESILSEYDELKCGKCDTLIFGGGRRKRSVSFNECIDRTTFKSDCCVESMKSTIQQRQQEKKHDCKKRSKARRRRRSNSGGSFSGDDVSTSDSVSDSTEHLSSMEVLDIKEDIIEKRTALENEYVQGASSKTIDGEKPTENITTVNVSDNRSIGEEKIKSVLTNSLIYDLD